MLFRSSKGMSKGMSKGILPRCPIRTARHGLSTLLLLSRVYRVNMLGIKGGYFYCGFVATASSRSDYSYMVVDADS